MASNPKDPMSKFFDVDIVKGNRSNFNNSYTNRLSADFGYIYPVGLWDVPSDSNFKLDLIGTLSSNPTLAPLLGTVKLRVEAYFVEKACYVNTLRNNDKLPIDRNVPFPTIDFSSFGRDYFSSRGSLLEMLQLLPANFKGSFIGSGDSPDDRIPPMNAIPLIMYYDIYRNYYVNPQDDNIPIRYHGYVPGLKNSQGGWDREPSPIVDLNLTRVDLDAFVMNCRDNLSKVNQVYDECFGMDIVPYFDSDSMYEPNGLYHDLYKHYGLLRRTYNNDFFTSFISNDNVELMKSSANVGISTVAGQQVVNVEMISLANRNWRIRTRSLLWGTDWKDYNKVHYGVNLIIPYGKPQFLGSLSSNISFNDVISQAQTGSQDSDIGSNVNLGSRASLAFGGVTNFKNGDKKRDKDHEYFININVKDEGYIMVVASIVPEVSYYQGIDPMYFKTNLQHSWMQELNSVGMQDFHRAWMTVSQDDTNGQTIGWSSWNVAEHKVPIWYEYMAKYNQLHGDFTGSELNRYWVFARVFSNLQSLFGRGVFTPIDEQIDVTDIYTSTYVLPEMYNYIFANNIGNDNFQLQFRFDVKVNSMLDKQVISYL